MDEDSVSGQDLEEYLDSFMLTDDIHKEELIIEDCDSKDNVNDIVIVPKTNSYSEFPVSSATQTSKDISTFTYDSFLTQTDLDAINYLTDVNNLQQLFHTESTNTVIIQNQEKCEEYPVEFPILQSTLCKPSVTNSATNQSVLNISHSQLPVREKNTVTNNTENDLENLKNCRKPRKRSCAKKFYCEGCNKGFSEQKFLQSHIKFHCPVLSKYVLHRYRCFVCDKCFGNFGTLQQHVTKVHDLKISAKEAYKHSVGRKDSNIESSIIPDDISKKSNCENRSNPVVNKSFESSHVTNQIPSKDRTNSENSLQDSDVHRDIVTTENDSNSSDCTVYQEERHLETSLTKTDQMISGKEYFDCKHCNQRYRTQNSLSVHLKLHCPILLNRKHLSRLHTKYQIQCNMCGKVFSKDRSMRLHFLMAHNLKIALREVTYYSKIVRIDKSSTGKVDKNSVLNFISDMNVRSNTIEYCDNTKTIDDAADKQGPLVLTENADRQSPLLVTTEDAEKQNPQLVAIAEKLGSMVTTEDDVYNFAERPFSSSLDRKDYFSENESQCSYLPSVSLQGGTRTASDRNEDENGVGKLDSYSQRANASCVITGEMISRFCTPENTNNNSQVISEPQEDQLITEVSGNSVCYDNCKLPFKEQLCQNTVASSVNQDINEETDSASDSGGNSLLCPSAITTVNSTSILPKFDSAYTKFSNQYTREKCNQSFTQLAALKIHNKVSSNGRDKRNHILRENSEKECVNEGNELQKDEFLVSNSNQSETSNTDDIQDNVNSEILRKLLKKDLMQCTLCGSVSISSQIMKFHLLLAHKINVTLKETEGCCVKETEGCRKMNSKSLLELPSKSLKNSEPVKPNKKSSNLNKNSAQSKSLSETSTELIPDSNPKNSEPVKPNKKSSNLNKNSAQSKSLSETSTELIPDSNPKNSELVKPNTKSKTVKRNIKFSDSNKNPVQRDSFSDTLLTELIRDLESSVVNSGNSSSSSNSLPHQRNRTCDRRFPGHSNLQTHYMRDCPCISRIACAICGELRLHASEMKFHVKMKHNVDITLEEAQNYPKINLEPESDGITNNRILNSNIISSKSTKKQRRRNSTPKSPEISTSNCLPTSTPSCVTTSTPSCQPTSKFISTSNCVPTSTASCQPTSTFISTPSCQPTSTFILTPNCETTSMPSCQLISTFTSTPNNHPISNPNSTTKCRPNLKSNCVFLLQPVPPLIKNTKSPNVNSALRLNSEDMVIIPTQRVKVLENLDKQSTNDTNVKSLKRKEPESEAKNDCSEMKPRHTVKNRTYSKIFNSSIATDTFRETSLEKDNIPRRKQDFKCIDCEKSMSTPYILSLHREYSCPMLPQKRLECPECQRLCSSPLYMRYHMLNAHNIKVTLKDAEKYKKVTLDSTKTSLQKTKRKRRTLCDVTKMSDFEKPYVCVGCSKGFTNIRNMKKHYDYHCPGQRKYRFQCVTCFKLFSSVQVLQTHVLMIHDTRITFAEAKRYPKLVLKPGHTVKVHENVDKHQSPNDTNVKHLKRIVNDDEPKNDCLKIQIIDDSTVPNVLKSQLHINSEDTLVLEQTLKVHESLDKQYPCNTNIKSVKQKIIGDEIKDDCSEIQIVRDSTSPIVNSILSTNSLDTVVPEKTVKANENIDKLYTCNSKNVKSLKRKVTENETNNYDCSVKLKRLRNFDSDNSGYKKVQVTDNVCNVCSQSFESVHSLLDHLQIHLLECYV